MSKRSATDTPPVDVRKAAGRDPPAALPFPPRPTGAPPPNRATRATIAIPESDRPDRPRASDPYATRGAVRSCCCSCSKQSPIFSTIGLVRSNCPTPSLLAWHSGSRPGRLPPSKQLWPPLPPAGERQSRPECEVAWLPVSGGSSTVATSRASRRRPLPRGEGARRISPGANEKRLVSIALIHDGAQLSL